MYSLLYQASAVSVSFLLGLHTPLKAAYLTLLQALMDEPMYNALRTQVRAVQCGGLGWDGVGWGEGAEWHNTAR